MHSSSNRLGVLPWTWGWSCSHNPQMAPFSTLLGPWNLLFANRNDGLTFNMCSGRRYYILTQPIATTITSYAMLLLPMISTLRHYNPLHLHATSSTIAMPAHNHPIVTANFATLPPPTPGVSLSMLTSPLPLLHLGPAAVAISSCKHTTIQTYGNTSTFMATHLHHHCHLYHHIH